jgi:hypothetical protein
MPPSPPATPPPPPRPPSPPPSPPMAPRGVMTIGNAEHAWLRKVAPTTNYAGTSDIYWDANSAYAGGAQRTSLASVPLDAAAAAGLIALPVLPPPRARAPYPCSPPCWPLAACGPQERSPGRGGSWPATMMTMVNSYVAMFCFSGVSERQHETILSKTFTASLK